MPKPVSAFSLFKPSKEAVLNNFFTFLVIVFLPAFLILVGEAMNLRNIQVSSESGIWQLPSIRPESIPYYWLGGLLSFALLPAGFYLELQAAKGEKLALGSRSPNH